MATSPESQDWGDEIVADWFDSRVLYTGLVVLVAVDASV